MEESDKESDLSQCTRAPAHVSHFRLLMSAGASMRSAVHNDCCSPTLNVRFLVPRLHMFFDWRICIGSSLQHNSWSTAYKALVRPKPLNPNLEIQDSSLILKVTVKV